MVKSRRGRAGGTVTAARGCWWRRRNAVLRHGEPQYAWRPVAVKGRWQTGQVLVPVSSRDGSAFVAVSSRDGPAASSWRRVWTGAGGWSIRPPRRRGGRFVVRRGGPCRTGRRRGRARRGWV